MSAENEIQLPRNGAFCRFRRGAFVEGAHARVRLKGPAWVRKTRAAAHNESERERPRHICVSTTPCGLDARKGKKCRVADAFERSIG